MKKNKKEKEIWQSKQIWSWPPSLKNYLSGWVGKTKCSFSPLYNRKQSICTIFLGWYIKLIMKFLKFIEKICSGKNLYVNFQAWVEAITKALPASLTGKLPSLQRIWDAANTWHERQGLLLPHDVQGPLTYLNCWSRQLPSWSSFSEVWAEETCS